MLMSAAAPSAKTILFMAEDEITDLVFVIGLFRDSTGRLLRISLFDFRLAFDLQNNRRRDLARGIFRHSNRQAGGIGFRFQPFMPAEPVGFQEFGALDLVLEAGQDNFTVLRPIRSKDMQIKGRVFLADLLGATAPGQLRWE